MKQKITNILGILGLVVKKNPLLLLNAFLAFVAMIAIYKVENGDYAQKEQLFSIWTKIFLVAILGNSLLFALSILADKYGKKIILMSIGIGIQLLFYFFLMPNDFDNITIRFFTIYSVSIICSHLLVSFAAYLSRSNTSSFWYFNKNLFVNIILTGLFAHVLLGGLELAVLSVDKLFFLGLSTKIYVYISFFVTGFGSYLIFLLFNKNGLSSLEADENYPAALKTFVQFILIPLLFIYGTILYTYGVQILIHSQLPRGWVTYMIMAYSILGIFALLLVYPLRSENTKGWVVWFSKIFFTRCCLY